MSAVVSGRPDHMSDYVALAGYVLIFLGVCVTGLVTWLGLRASNVTNRKLEPNGGRSVADAISRIDRSTRHLPERMARVEGVMNLPPWPDRDDDFPRADDANKIEGGEKEVTG